MVNKDWGRMLAMAMAATFTVTSVPFSANAAGEDSLNGIADAYADEGYTLKWHDEFDGTDLDTSAWNVEQHEPGWVNQEKQRYTAIDEGNIEVHDGSLHIISKYEAPESTEESGDEEAADAELQDLKLEFSVGEDKAESETIALQVNFGAIDFSEDADAGSAKASVVLSDLSLKDVTDGEESEELLRDTKFENGNWSDWGFGANEDGKADGGFEDGQVKIKIEDAGSCNYAVQLQQGGLKLIPGHKYVFTMKALSDVNRATEISFLDPENGYDWYAGGKLLIEGSGAGGNGSAKTGNVTSGRITTQNKMDFTYGRFEARAKVPEGKGFLPAFWLMATDENFYGQWPKCGEIDIMEVMGQDTSKSYHTIHYGYNSSTGHKENQGTKTLEDGTYSDDFHVFRADWEPGKISWYVDDEFVCETSDWYTGTDDDNQLTYPAPFDQDFYVILNLAVGGSWVGYPDDYESIDGKEFEVDYVRVYQKDDETYAEGESGAERPVHEVVFRDADENGNYVKNGDFASDLAAEGTDAANDNFVLHLEADAKGQSTYTIDGNAITINPGVKGEKDYSVQLKQLGIPMYKGWEYELSFTASASEARNIIAEVEGPDNGWVRYMPDTTFELTTEPQTFTYKFTMDKKTDANGSLEFNLGNQDSDAAVTISDVKLTHVSGEEVVDTKEKDICSDGNYIHNGSFDQGDKRLGYWEFDEEDAAQISVTNDKSKKRELEVKVVVPEGASEANPVTISQSELAPAIAGEYALTFNAYMTDGEKDGLTVKAFGHEFTPGLTKESQGYREYIVLDKDMGRDEANVEFSFTKPGTYFLDDVYFSDIALLKNGSFNAGLAGFSPYVDGAADASYVVDSINNDNSFIMSIKDTGDAANDWYVQLNQDGINIEEGKYYYLAFKAKSTLDRKIKYSLQQFEGNWTNYSGTGDVDVTSDWQEFSHAFKMTNPTDANTRFNITFGSLNGERITEPHEVAIDDIVLCEISEEEYKSLTGEQGGETPSEQPTETPSENAEGAAQTPAQETAPAVTTDNKETAKVQTKVNGNGKADKGEVKVTKTAVYKVTGKKTASYSANPDSVKKNVTVPATTKVDGAKVKVTKIAKKAFKGNTNIKRITLGKNIKTIGKNAFDGCTNLKKITVKSANLKKIEKSAFKNCKLDKDFKVVVYAADEENYNKMVDLFKNAGLDKVTFVFKKK